MAEEFHNVSLSSRASCWGRAQLSGDSSRKLRRRGGQSVGHPQGLWSPRRSGMGLWRKGQNWRWQSPQIGRSAVFSMFFQHVCTFCHRWVIAAVSAWALLRGNPGFHLDLDLGSFVFDWFQQSRETIGVFPSAISLQFHQFKRKYAQCVYSSSSYARNGWKPIYLAKGLEILSLCKSECLSNETGLEMLEGDNKL